MQEAVAKTEQARVAYESQIGGVHTSVARLRADLRDAEFDLDMTTVRAPGPGFVTQLALRPGMYVVPAPLRPVMVFVHEDDRTLAAGSSKTRCSAYDPATRPRLPSTPFQDAYSRAKLCGCSTPLRQASFKRAARCRTWANGCLAAAPSP